MSNAVALAGGTGLISREDLAKGLNNAAMSMPAVGANGKQFLKMDRGNGDWVFGQEETVVEEDSLWAVNPASLMHGYVAWDTNAGGPPVQEIMVPVSRPLPAESSLPELGLGAPDKKSGKQEQLTYQRQQSVDLVCISGEDEGTICEYKQSSVGAMKLFATLTNDLLTQLEKDADAIVPIVRIKSEAYKHKTYGRIFNPVWEIVEWRTMDDTSAPDTSEDDADEQDEKAEAKPPRRRGDSAKAKPEQAAASSDGGDEDDDLEAEYKAEEEAQAPRRRRRR